MKRKLPIGIQTRRQTIRRWHRFRRVAQFFKSRHNRAIRLTNRANQSRDYRQ